MRYQPLSLLLCGLVLAGPATRPATNPAPVDAAAVEQAWASLDAARGELRKATDAATQRWQGTPRGSALWADYLKRQREADIRTDNAEYLQEKVQAFQKAAKAADAAKREFLRNDAGLKAATAALAKSEASFSAFGAAGRRVIEDRQRAAAAKWDAAEEKRMKDPLYRAVKEKRIAVGMTLSQASAVMGPDPTMKEATERDTVYVWWMPAGYDVVSGKVEPGETGVYHVDGVFVSGKLVSFRRYAGSQPRAVQVGPGELPR